MKSTWISLAIAAVVSGIALPATAQSSSQPTPQNRASLIKVYGRVAQVNENQFVLNSNIGQLTVSKQQSINLALNEPVTVTGTIGGQPSTLSAYSITRADGTNITFTATGISVQRLIDSLN
jgi:hypothetical protein